MALYTSLMVFRPDQRIQKALISTTSRLVGEYERADALLAHAWPNFGTPDVHDRWREAPISRSAYIFVFEVPEDELNAEHIPSYAGAGEYICAILAILYGKRFDSHGLTESLGFFCVPDLSSMSKLCLPSSPFNSHRPRVDYAVPLKLSELSRLEPLLDNPDHAHLQISKFVECAKFYLRALQSAEENPEIAYLHLITALEMLSYQFDYPKEELLDDDARAVLAAVQSNPDASKLANTITHRLRQIKRRFIRSITELVDPSFFDRTEGPLNNPLRFRPKAQPRPGLVRIPVRRDEAPQGG